jgi:amidophosphoribosyltransferase
MSTVGELFAPRFMKDRIPTFEEQAAMARELEADSVYYLPIDAISRCINLPEDRLCRACISGSYPTPTGEKLYQLALREPTQGRTYEKRVC